MPIDSTHLSSRVLGMRVDATDYARATSRIIELARAGCGAYVCAANVHMCMEAYDDPAFRAVVEGAALVTPDGMPLVYMLRRLGFPAQTRVYGPDLTLHVLAAAAAAGIAVGLYGGEQTTLDSLQRIYRERYPGLSITYAHSPPFRRLSEAEDAVIVDSIRAAGVGLLLVGLGCPKQERWVAAHRDRLPCAQLAIGAAFAFHAGEVSQAPSWMQRLSLEWLYRLCAEPRRLWRRYLYNNPRFLALAGWQLARGAR